MKDDPSELWARLRAQRHDEELLGRLATLARSEGQAGGRTSAWMSRSAEMDPDHLAVAIDAHVLGLLDRQAREALRRRREMVPLLTLGSATIAVLAGLQDVEILDEVLPAGIQRAIGQQSRWFVVEVSCAEKDETLAHTLAGLSRIGLPEALRIGVCGDAPEAWVERCLELSDAPRLEFRDSLLPLLQGEAGA